MNSVKITVLGSGTCVPSLARSCCSIHAETGKSRLLFDTGAGTMRRMLEAGKSIFQVTHLFYSHLHPDHTGELASLLFSQKYAGSIKREFPLTIIAARGFKAFYENLLKVYGRWITFQPEMINIIEMNNEQEGKVSFDDFDVETAPVNHTEHSIAFRITTPCGTSFVYSGDTDESESLIKLSRKTNLLICECAFPDEKKVEGHLTPSLAGKAAAGSSAKKLMLTHFYPECDNVDIVKQCSKTYKGEIILAEDLISLTI